MSEWRTETAADLARAAEMLEDVLKALSGEPKKEELRSIWLAYIKVEKSVAFIKFEMDEENPGRFIKLRPYVIPDERQALQFALKNLKKGSVDFALGDFRLALKNLRESRNYLRALLRQKRLARARNARSS